MLDTKDVLFIVGVSIVALTGFVLLGGSVLFGGFIAGIWLVVASFVAAI